jgi:catechol 2,3-dioxygenase-like lactoylglutathione lyase family enzyme
MPDLGGVNHVALTVTDLAHSAEWYERVLGLTKVMETDLFEGHPVTLFMAPSGLFIGLHQDRRVQADDRFDEFRAGLDHVGFNCGGRAELEEWIARFDGMGVAHSGVVEAEYGQVVVFRDPDNIQLELFAPPGV